jgi:hypothetical protein
MSLPSHFQTIRSKMKLHKRAFPGVENQTVTPNPRAGVA